MSFLSPIQQKRFTMSNIMKINLILGIIVVIISSLDVLNVNFLQPFFIFEPIRKIPNMSEETL